jgi:hypothetical protein
MTASELRRLLTVALVTGSVFELTGLVGMVVKGAAPGPLFPALYLVGCVSWSAALLGFCVLWHADVAAPAAPAPPAVPAPGDPPRGPFRCPDCRSPDRVWVRAGVDVRFVNDAAAPDGFRVELASGPQAGGVAQASSGPLVWDDDSPAHCRACGVRRVLSAFAPD